MVLHYEKLRNARENLRSCGVVSICLHHSIPLRWSRVVRMIGLVSETSFHPMSILFDVLVGQSQGPSAFMAGPETIVVEDAGYPELLLDIIVRRKSV